MDPATATLLNDLKERGLLEKTVVVWMGEFGRTPKINANISRDHWPHCYTVLLAGGGTKRGFVHGSSDETGSHPASNPVTPDDVAATIYYLMGIDPRSEVMDAQGRPIMISSGNPIMEATPGSFEALPQGWSLDSWNPEYPNIETGDFRKAMLRGVGTSLGMSYNTLGNDLESVNFSSARVGLFEEREMWKGLQSWYSETFWEPVFADWLEQSILNAAVALPLGKFAKFNRPVFKARRWPFIDPLKEVSAAKEAMHRSHRTGEATCSTSESTNARRASDDKKKK
mgnify:CR=1 FL=1